MHRRHTVTLLLASLLVVVASGCGDDPFAIRWTENPEEATLHTLDRPEPSLVSGFNLLERRGVRIEAPQADGRWDFALERSGGALYLLPPRLLGIQDSRAGIVPVDGAVWDEVREAPRDSTLYRFAEPVRVRAQTVYIIQTHEQAGSFARRCVFYGKVEPVAIDVERGALRFRFDVSPDCNNRSLVPPGS